MNRYHTYQDVNSTQFLRTVVGIGNFDGVHLGHQALISAVTTEAKRRDLTPSVLTFDPHPLRFFMGDQGPAQIYSSKDRVDVLADLGIETILTQDFTLEFAQLSPRAFVEEVIVKSLRAALVVVGYDFAFGARRAGTITDLNELGAEFGFEVKVIDAQMTRSDEQMRAYSSTWIRELISEGEVAYASLALGRAFHLRALVVKGLQRGRSLGFPTANLALLAELCPKPGVYSGWLDWGEGPNESVISVGLNPTFSDAYIPQSSQRWSVEVHVLNRESDELSLYDRSVCLWFADRLRDMRRFTSAEELVIQISLDCKEALANLKGRAKPMNRSIVL